MPDPSALPLELFDIILDYLGPNVSVAPPLLAENRKWDQLADLSACSLVSRTWHIYGLPKLYQAFRFQGHLHSFWRLWKFIRTTVENPYLATLVQCLDLGEYYYVYTAPREITQAENRQTSRESCKMHKIARKIFIPDEKLIADLRTENHGLYQLLLISILPNVSRLYLSSNGRCSEWRFWICYLLEERSLLHNLKVAMWYPLFYTEPYRTFDERDIDHITHAFFFLPLLEELVLFELDLYLDGSDPRLVPKPEFDPKMYRTSPVKKLTICPSFTELVCSYDTRSYLQNILQLPRSLVSLTLCMPRKKMKDGGGFESLLTGDQLWRILYHSRDSLEYLDIYNFDAAIDEERIQQNTPLGLLCDYSRLKDLRVQPNLLVGGTGGITAASFRLCDTLPRSLQFLTVYDSNGCGSSFIDQLIEWNLKGSTSPTFKCLTLQRQAYCVDVEKIVGSSSLREQTLPRSGRNLRYIERNGTITWPCDTKSPAVGP